MIEGLHHVALIVSDYNKSKLFYTATLRLNILSEIFRAPTQSWKLDLAIPGGGRLELFSFPDPPARLTRPEATGLRHLAFSTRCMQAAIEELASAGIEVEPIRIDPHTGAKFTFFADPDGLPLELYEVRS